MTPSSVMIFAAGFGTRMMPLTRDKPKPMIEVNGTPLIDIALDRVRAINPERIVVNTHYKAEVLHDHLQNTDVVLTNEHPDILDTGGGLRHALPLLGPKPVWTMNPDVIWFGPNPLQSALRAWDPERMDALLVCVPPEKTHATKSDGDFSINEQGEVSRGGRLMYGGVQIIKTDLLHAIEQDAFSLNLLWDQMIAQKRCHAVIYPGQWCDVGYPEAIPIAEQLLKDCADV